jgi:hypothetical protein
MLTREKGPSKQVQVLPIRGLGRGLYKINEKLGDYLLSILKLFIRGLCLNQ